jgi:glycosyltransferase involved in cell wall biosynthesis
MRILLINQVFVSPDEPGHTRHFELAQFLKEQGHELVIVASDLNYQTGQRTVEPNGLYTEQNLDGVRVYRAHITSGLHRNYAARIQSYLSFMFRSIRVSRRVQDVDLVMGTTPPLFQAFSAWFVAWRCHKPFLLEVRDLWPEFAVSMGVIKNQFVIGLARMLERFLYRHADGILVNSPAYKEYLYQKGVPLKKINCIPYGADLDMFTPAVDGKRIRKDLGLDKKFIVLYAGALGEANDIDTVLRAADRLKENKDIVFVFFGDGKERPRLQAESERKGLKNVVFAGTRPKKEMPEVLAAADVCLAILKDIPMFRTTYPNKVFDSMASGKATILVIDGVIREVVETSGGGLFVNPADDGDLAKKVLALRKNPAGLKRMGTAARKYAMLHLNRRDKLEETMDLLTTLCLKGNCT